MYRAYVLNLYYGVAITFANAAEFDNIIISLLKSEINCAGSWNYT